jgi:uncharacterized protein
MSAYVSTILLLLVSNGFMLCAWYLHLNIKWLDNKAMVMASLLSWGIAFFEYQFHIPANRIGREVYSLEQLQIMQVGISLLMFIPFSMLVMKSSFKWDYVIATVLLIGAAYFIFRSK